MFITAIFALIFLQGLTGVIGQSVITGSGPVDGISLKTPLGKTVRAFLGVPFAEPPVGKLRFKPPLPAQPWTVAFKATKKSKSCVQFVPPNHMRYFSEFWVPPVEDTSEDCLTLNVWVPDPTPKNAAVMVWIYGGGFEGGTSTSKLYDGQLLATEGDVIVVSLNYRVGAFGFLYLDPEEAPGNVGLMDQALGLQWVQDNIAKFGGDPAKVTIFGQSAGGASVSHHLTIPSSRGLFKRAIAQSGSSNSIWAGFDTYTATKIGEQFAHYTSCNQNAKDRKAMVDCLREVEVERMVQTAFEIPVDQPLLFAPVFDGVYLPDTPENVIKSQGADRKVDIMLGATTQDGLIFALEADAVLEPREDSYIDDAGFLAYIKNVLGFKKDSAAKFVKLFYTDWEDPQDLNKIRKQFLHFLTDLFFLCDINRLNDLLATNQNRVFRYQFSHHPSILPIPAWTGSGHSDDLPFVFGMPLIKGSGFTDKEEKLSRTVINFWTNFAKHGDPNGLSKDGSPPWPVYTNKSRQHVHINDDFSLKVGAAKDIRIQECALFDKILPHYLESLHSTDNCKG